MITNTRGIVFHLVKYGDTGAVIKVFTEDYGLLAFLVKGLHNKRSRIRSNLFGKLSLLNMSISFHPNKNLQHMREASLAHNYTSISQDIRKSTVLMFLNEMVYKSIREEETNRALFQLIYRSLIWFDRQEEHFANFHLHFLIALTRHLGFFPATDYTAEKNIFDLEEGHFTKYRPRHTHIIPHPLSQTFYRLATSNLENMPAIQVKREERRALLENILSFYRIHLPGFHEIRSYPVLQTILE
ncbi:MAG: DNA repair protein RecO [Bacteroidales bacterium]